MEFNASGKKAVHFFDAAKVDGDIIVRQASEGEQFTDLFGSVHSLQASDMVIADKNKILALAGIVGGIDSGISESTQDILVEIAHFDPVVVRKTGTRLGLRTDAELRYEKHINPRWSAYCLLLLLDELKYYQKDLGSFALGGEAYYISSKLEAGSSKQINVDISKMEHFIFGQEQKDFGKKASTWLEKLGFTLSGKTTLTLTPPLWRSPDDINITEDIYEEVARMSGYDEISPLPVNFPITHTAYTPLIDIQRKIEDILVRNFGCDQTESYPWIGDKAVSLRNLDPAQLYALQNPVNPEAPYLRNSMAPGLLNHIIKNHKFFDTCKIFDLGKVWKRDERKKTKDKSKYASSFVDEETELGIMLYQKDVANWDHDPLLQAKDMVRTLLRDL
jgi:phenylalanyl-tRNA synthetase beta chain